MLPAFFCERPKAKGSVQVLILPNKNLVRDDFRGPNDAPLGPANDPIDGPERFHALKDRNGVRDAKNKEESKDNDDHGAPIASREQIGKQSCLQFNEGRFDEESDYAPKQTEHQASSEA
jgi:hypothetical protein